MYTLCNCLVVVVHTWHRAKLGTVHCIIILPPRLDLKEGSGISGSSVPTSIRATGSCCLRVHVKFLVGFWSFLPTTVKSSGFSVKVHILWEGHKILQNLHLTFDHSTYSQRLRGDFAKFCGLLRIYELYFSVTYFFDFYKVTDSCIGMICLKSINIFKLSFIWLLWC